MLVHNLQCIGLERAHTTLTSQVLSRTLADIAWFLRRSTQKVIVLDLVVPSRLILRCERSMFVIESGVVDLSVRWWRNGTSKLSTTITLFSLKASKKSAVGDGKTEWVVCRIIALSAIRGRRYNTYHPSCHIYLPQATCA